MSSPFDASRDSLGGSFDMGTQPDLADSDVGAFRDAFKPPTDQLSEEDYRGSEHGGSGAGFEPVTPQHEPAQAPGDFGYPTPKPGGFVNL